MDEHGISLALALADRAQSCGEVPVGAVLMRDDQVVGEGYNQPIRLCDPTAHAEVVALRAAAQRVGNYRLLETTLYVTLEPCAMCLGALLHARIKRLVFGAFDHRAGAVTSVFNLLEEKRLNHAIIWQGGVMQDKCALLLKNFFKQRR